MCLSFPPKKLQLLRLGQNFKEVRLHFLEKSVKRKGLQIQRNLQKIQLYQRNVEQRKGAPEHSYLVLTASSI